MAKRKKDKLEDVKNFVANKESIVEDIIAPAVKDHFTEKVLELREKGYNDNQIAGMLMIHKQKIENIK